MALSVIEQRYRAVMAVLDGASPTEVAAEAGVSRQSVHAWVRRYRAAGLAGLADRPSRPRSSPNQASAQVEARVRELRDGQVVTGVDDHSRFCVLARVVERATGRAICLAFSEAPERYAASEEVLTDNSKQFTARLGGGGEVLFDKICRRAGVAHGSPSRACRP